MKQLNYNLLTIKIQDIDKIHTTLATLNLELVNLDPNHKSFAAHPRDTLFGATLSIKWRKGFEIHVSC